MHRVRPLLLLLPLTVGCYSEEEYYADFYQETCTWYADCQLLDSLNFDSVDDCVSEYAARHDEDVADGDDVCIDYDAKAAKACTEALSEVACDDRAETYPAVCSQVCADPE